MSVSASLFGNAFKGKRVLVTGHTGFKGSWLSMWLLELGADVTGYSIGIPTIPSNFQVSGVGKKLRHCEGDVRDVDALKRVFDAFSPEIVFHLAAQAITRRSYDMPRETFFTNLGGTVNVLECIRTAPSVKAAVMITSDKCYHNVEWVWGYRENDRLGGDDPYSASKACAEIAAHAYMKSFFGKRAPARIATARAGNVIGGGDWAADRIVPDCVRAFSKKERLKIRSPHATRPWQHVLEPLSGYLWLAANLLMKNEDAACESYNFGPLSEVNRSVEELISAFSKRWGKGKWSVEKINDRSKKESTLLKLNCDKALRDLQWSAVLSFEDTVKMTADWYASYYSGYKNMYGFTVRQIQSYVKRASARGLPWAREKKR